jgi:hypothetical protein
MKAEELRIGNWYQWYAEGKYYEYQVIQSDFSNDCNFLNFEPIPLTKEWLVKFGFKPLNGHEFSFWLDEWECLSLYAEPYPKSFAIGLSRGLKDIWSTGKIQNVHQLQNLYFALTGQELTIK